MSKKVLGALLFNLLIFKPSFTIASLKFEIPELSSTRLEQARAFEIIQQISDVLPEKIKSAIDRKIVINFNDMGDVNFDPLCPKLVNTADTLSLLEKDKSISDHAEKHTRGALKISGLKKDNYQIFLHTKFKSVILGGPQQNKQQNKKEEYNCGHRNLYKLALGTIIHEIAHIYDNLQVLSKEERELIRHCQMERVLNSEQPESFACKQTQEYEKTISTRKSYQSLAGFKSNNNKNSFYLRLPDPYESTNPAEHFAVNLEYYLLDKEYPCRRPVLNNFFNKYFNSHVRASKSSCESSDTVFLSSSELMKNMQRIAHLDVTRIYQIHYLLADQGADLSSRWGHSMIRLVVCSPDRATVGPECMKDVGYHLVLSFRANVSDLVIDTLKGLFGGYPSRAFIFTLPEIINEYALGELRNLKSYPIQLTEEKKNLFVYKILELFWEYSGRYYFATNNCASETFDLIRSVLNHDELNYESIYSPLGLYEILKKYHLIDTSVLSNQSEAIKNKYLFLSISESLNAAVERLKNYGFKISNRDSYAHDTSAAERMDEYVRIIYKKEGKTLLNIDRIKILANLRLLELHILENLQKKIGEKSLSLFEAIETGKIPISDQESLKILDEYKRFVRSLILKLPQVDMRPGSYGIPTKEDFPSQFTPIANVKNPLDSALFLNNSIFREINDLLDEKHQIENFIDLLEEETIKI